MTGRSVPEWRGASPDTPVPARVKLRVFEAHGGRCYLTGLKINAGDDWDVEHVKPLSMHGENRESNLAPALKAPHAVKTAAEATSRAKADRVRKKHLGVWPEPVRKLRGRGFAPSRRLEER